MKARSVGIDFRLLAVAGIGAMASGPAYGQAEPIILHELVVEGEGGTAENATAPGNGYVAKRTATASKTDAAIIETPQAISLRHRIAGDWLAAC